MRTNYEIAKSLFKQVRRQARRTVRAGEPFAQVIDAVMLPDGGVVALIVDIEPGRRYGEVAYGVATNCGSVAWTACLALACGWVQDLVAGVVSADDHERIAAA